MRSDCKFQVLSANLNERLFRERTPLSGGIELTSTCNFQCIHCYEAMERDGNGKVMSTKRLIEIIDELIQMGVVSVFLTGGESMLRQDFDDIYSYLRKRGVLVEILSNGSTITEEKCQMFKKYMPRLIDISLYGATEETYRHVTGRTGAFQNVLEGIERLKKYGIPFQLKTVLLSVNQHELGGMRKIAQQYNVPFKFFTSIRPCNDGNTAPVSYMLSEQEILDLESQDFAMLQYYKEKKETKVLRELSERQKENCTYLCRIAKNSFFISYDGILNGCVRSRRHGFDLKKGTFSDGWQYLLHTFVDPTKKEPFSCSQCQIMNYCDFCPGEFEIETGDPTVAPKAICNLAHKRYEKFGVPENV